MKTQLTDKSGVIIAVALCLFSVIVFELIITPSGISIAKAGEEMPEIRSVSGDSIAEAYDLNLR